MGVWLISCGLVQRFLVHGTCYVITWSVKHRNSSPHKCIFDLSSRVSKETLFFVFSLVNKLLLRHHYVIIASWWRHHHYVMTLLCTGLPDQGTCIIRRTFSRIVWRWVRWAWRTRRTWRSRRRWRRTRRRVIVTVRRI